MAWVPETSLAIAASFCHNYAMSRRIVVNLLLLAIILCPFNCMGGFKSLFQVAKSSVSVCDCCAPRSTSTTDSSDCADQDKSNNQPGRDKPSDGCPNCICHGALVGSNVNVSDIDSVDTGWPDPIAFEFVLPVSKSSMAALQIVRRYQSFVRSGIFVRISHRSLLI